MLSVVGKKSERSKLCQKILLKDLQILLSLWIKRREKVVINHTLVLKKSRNRLTVEKKLEVIKLYEKCASFAQVAREKEIAESTIRKIVSQKSELKKYSVHTANYGGLQLTKTRSRAMLEMERLLLAWINDCTNRNLPISLKETQLKAVSLYGFCKSKIEDLTPQEIKETFVGSNGWWDKFSERENLGSVNLLGEAGSADVKAAEEFPEIFRKIIEEGGYSEQQIFNVDEAGLFWKMAPTRSIVKKTRKVPGLKLAKSRSTILVGGNASGDLKLKPLFIHTSENPRCLKGVKKATLPVFWASNKKAWMKAELFENWFKDNFIPQVKRFCRMKKIPFKILLLVDNCTGHPDLSHIDPNVKMMFLPPNTTSLIQPMDQGVIATLKALYKRITFEKAHETHNTLVEFYKDYDIFQAVTNFGIAWGMITQKNMKGVWKKLLPREESNEPPTEIIEEVVNLGVELDIELTTQDVKEILVFDERKMSNEDLFEVCEPTEGETESEESNDATENPQNLSLKQLKEILKRGQEFTDLINDLDPIHERQVRVIKDIDKALRCYKEEALEKSKIVTNLAKQSKVTSFFTKNVDKPGPSGQKSSNEELNEALAILSDED